MEKFAYHIEISKGKIPMRLFSYPCEEISEELLNGRKIHIYGKPIEGFQLLSNSSLDECTDLIIMPSGIDRSEESIENYYKELFYYQDPILGNQRIKNGNIKNVIFLLPAGSSLYSTNYIKMADYATVGFVKGLSKNAAYMANGVYGVILPEKIEDVEPLKNLMLYLLSSNSDHIVCNIIRLDRK